MEVLSRLLKKTEEGDLGVSKQVPMREKVCIFLIFLFADDTILFCYASREQLLYIRMVLIFFEAITSLKVNVSKSESVPIGEVGNLDALARNLML